MDRHVIAWWCRPYEGSTWIRTETQPTDELRRWMQFVPIWDNAPDQPPPG